MSTSGLKPSVNVVVDLAGFRSEGRRTDLRLNDKTTGQHPDSDSAELLSVRRHLSYQASVEIDGLESIKEQYGDAFTVALVKKVRLLLNKEFGKLRVHRYRRLYVIRHRSVEGLISSLLRVQFHAHQLNLPTLNKNGDAIEMKHVTLTWGVGRTTTEAQVERLRRRRHKMKR